MTLSSEKCTGFAFRFEHRKWNRGRNRLPKLVQTIAGADHFLCSNLKANPVKCGYVPIHLIIRYKRLVPLPLSGRRASANLVPISPPSSNHFGSSFALRRIPQLEYRGEGKASFGYFWGRLTDH